MAPYAKNVLHLKDKFKLNVKVHIERLPNTPGPETVIQNKQGPPQYITRSSKNLSTVQVKTGNSGPTKEEQIKNNRNLCVRFVDTRQRQTKKQLRKRKTKNYAELSVCSPNEKSVTNKSDTRIPIYLKQDVATKPNKKLQKDPFEFVPETPRRRFQKQELLLTKHGSPKSNRDSILYDKDTHHIVKKIEAKEQAKIRAVKQAHKKQCKLKVKVNGIKLNEGSTTKGNRIVVKEPTNIAINPKDDIKGCFGFTEEDESLIIPASPFATILTNKKRPTGKEKNNLHKFVISTSTPVLKRQLPTRKAELGNRKRINVISDLQVFVKPHQPNNNNNLENRFDNSIIRQSHPKVPLLKQGASAATSTPQNNQRLRKQIDHSLVAAPSLQNQSTYTGIKSPWRTDSANVSRNPHFLAMKSTFLPSYNQQMVLDSTLLEKQQSRKITIQNNEKSMLQTSMVEFVTGSLSKPKTPSKTLMDQSLFNESEFSPLKSFRNEKISSKSPSKVKRNVFGILKPSNRQNVIASGPAYDVDNYFGFESFNDENDENKENRLNTQKPKKKLRIAAQPTRIILKEAKNLQENIVHNLLENVKKVVDQEEDFPKEQMDDVPQVALFDDLEVIPQPRRSYERKRPRRVRLKSVDSDISEEIIKPKVKRKDVRTPQEEAAFNKWVSEFNAMCAEVENHTLETD